MKHCKPNTWLLRAGACLGAFACLIAGASASGKPKKPAPKASPTAPIQVAPAPEVAPAPKAVPAATVTAPAPVDPATLRQSVSVGVLGLGDYGAVYTYTLGGGLALVGEVFGQYGSGESASGTVGGGAQVGARWHTNGTQRSWFVGMMAGYDGGRTTKFSSASIDSATVKRTYELPYTRWRVTANFGRRWVFGPGFALTARVGAGKGERAYARGGDVAANGEAAAQESLYNFLPISIDAETSIGWVF